MRCDRCGGSVEFLSEIHRFGDSAGHPIHTEHVCPYCQTKMERSFAMRLPADDPDLFAYVMALSDAVDALWTAHCRRGGISEFDAGVPIDV